MKIQLIFPMTFYVFYIWALAVFMFRTRLRAIKTGEVHIKYFQAYSGTGPTERTLLVGRHYDNQFQVPLLFLIVCTLHILIGGANAATVALAWAFVASRLLHSWVHLGSNHLQKRVLAFVAGWIIVLLLWAQLIYLTL
jgi:hypothetical protein